MDVQIARAVGPLLLMLLFYWPGLTNWFYQDDFGWLRLRQEVHTLRDVPAALFAPKAHGNMRPLGENAYWLGLSSVFGARALPFRIAAFLTQMASLLLLGAIALRLTGSRWAAFWAQVVWIANIGLAPAMSWSSIYNQVLSGFFFLLAFYFLLRRIEWAHWLAFVLGLGALEINVMYPAIAAVYAVMFDRSALKRIAPMFVVSGLYAAVHFHFAGAQPGVYAMHVDGSMVRTFATYWEWVMGRGPYAAVAVLSVAAASFVVRQAQRRDFVPLLGLAWFAVTLAPYLPLRDHLMDYYLAVPAIGITMIAAAAVARLPRWAAGAGIAVYLAISIPAAWATTQWNHARSEEVEDLVLGVKEIRRVDPGKTILLDGIGTELFQAGIADVPFLALEIPYVYLVPGSERWIAAPAELVTKFELPEGMARDAVESGRAVVYRMDGGVLRNATSRYRGVWKAGPPRFVNVGDEGFADYVSGDWGPARNGYRMLNGAGRVRMAAGSELTIGVFGTAAIREIWVNGVKTPVALTHRDNELSLWRAGVAETEWIEVEVRGRMVFGFMEVK